MCKIIRNLIAGILQNTYRLNIVRENISIAFPSLHHNELITSFYRNFVTLIYEMFIQHVSVEVLNKRCIFNSLYLFDRLYNEYDDIIVTSGHLGNWEWASDILALKTRYKVISIYKPFHNIVINKFVEHKRISFKKGILQDSEMFSIFHNSKYKRLIAFLGDQRPPISQHSYLVSFMNHKMIIDDTLARIAKIKHCPLIYIHTLISNNKYIYNPEIIFLPQQNLHLHDITYKYWEALYYDISQNPSYWLWSHKRFISTLNQKFSN